MKKIQLLQLLVLIPVLSIAFPNKSNFINHNINADFLLYNMQEDTTHISIADSKILITENDTAVNLKLERNEAVSKNKSQKKFNNVDVEIAESDKGTRIIVHQDGDTVQQFEMNFDDFDENSSEENYTIDKKEKNYTIEKSFAFGSKSKRNKFTGHWSAFEFGLNNYLTDDMSLSPDDPFMEINTSKSWNFNLNFAQVSIPIYQDRVGFVSGIGFEWSNYHFSNSNTIYRDTENRTIAPKDLSHSALKKNRLQTTFLTAPVLLEIQLGGNNNKRVAISGGIIAGLKLGAHTKYKTADNKEKNKDDFYLNSFRYGFTARVHYDDLGLFLNYYNTPLFMNSRGPELYPFAAGLIFSFN